MVSHSYFPCGRPFTYLNLAGLAYNTATRFTSGTEYSSTNLTLAQELWDAIDIDPGQVQIPHDVAHSLDLPPTQSFPWDPSFGVYVVNGYHNLHCIKLLHLSIMQYHNNDSLTYPFSHITHCLDSLRQDVLCHADDTLRYTVNSKSKASGVGQSRMCRSWSQLEEWAKQNSGCWRYLDAAQDRRNEMERWVYCPRDSPYHEKAQRWAAKHHKASESRGDIWPDFSSVAGLA